MFYSYLCVHDVRNGIHKLHDVLLQNLSGVCEVPDVTEAKDRHDLVAWNHGVQVTPTAYIIGYDLCPSISKAHSQQAADLVDGVLQNPGFHLWIIAVVLGDLWLGQGVLGNISHLCQPESSAKQEATMHFCTIAKRAVQPVKSPGAHQQAAMTLAMSSPKCTNGTALDLNTKELRMQIQTQVVTLLVKQTTGKIAASVTKAIQHVTPRQPCKTVFKGMYIILFRLY